MKKLLVHGARAVVNICDDKMDRKNQWVADKKRRCGYNKAKVHVSVVAQAFSKKPNRSLS